MTYHSDMTVEWDFGEFAAGVPEFTFSIYENVCHPEDLPTLLLESVKLGALHLNREQVMAWIGAAEVRQLELQHTPQDWNPAEQAACDRADDWRKENAA